MGDLTVMPGVMVRVLEGELLPPLKQRQQRTIKDWTAKQVEAAGAGKHRVSASLFLFVGPDRKSRRWIFRFTKPGARKVTEMGLGSWPVVTLADARDKVLAARKMVAAGQCPIEARREAQRPSITFGEVAGEYLEVAQKGFRGAKTVGNLRHLLTEHAKALAQRAIADIGSGHIEMALRDVWLQKPDVARRTMEVVFRVLKFARARKLGVSHVSDMKEDVAHLMPKVKVVSHHHAAMPYAELPGFVRELRGKQQNAVSACAIEFLVICATRAGETASMRWDDVNLQDKIWTIPAEMTKRQREHRVPLSARAMELLQQQRMATGGEGYVWQGRGRDYLSARGLYNYLTETMKVPVSVHGFRSSFRDYCGDETEFAREHVEACLAHAVGNAVERAYRRGDALEKRRVILETWSRYCGGEA
jgi:integrase